MKKWSPIIPSDLQNIWGVLWENRSKSNFWGPKTRFFKKNHKIYKNL